MRTIVMSSPLAAVLSLWDHRELLRQFTLRNVELRHKGSHLGLAWSVLQPLLILTLQVLVFGYIFHGSFGVLPNESRMDYGLGIFLGLSLYHFVAETLTVAPTLIVTNPNFVKRVVFPLVILPASAVGAAAFHLIVSLSLVLLGVLLFGQGLTLGMLWLPVALLPLVMTCLGISWLFSALGVFLRDTIQVMQFLATALMFASAVFYPASKIPAAAWTFMRFNPVLLSIEIARDGVLWHRQPNLIHVLYIWIFGILACWIGYVTFNRMKPAFADVL